MSKNDLINIHLLEQNENASIVFCETSNMFDPFIFVCILLQKRLIRKGQIFMHIEKKWIN